MTKAGVNAKAFVSMSVVLPRQHFNKVTTREIYIALKDCIAPGSIDFHLRAACPSYDLSGNVDNKHSGMGLILTHCIRPLANPLRCL